MGTTIGEEQMKRLIQEYRAKVCLSDFGRYEQAMLKTYNTYMGKRIYSEYSTAPADDWTATPYTATTKGDGGWLIPDQTTLPGWTGANIIPIYVMERAQLSALIQWEITCRVSYAIVPLKVRRFTAILLPKVKVLLLPKLINRQTILYSP